MTQPVTIVDAGVGNLGNLARAVAHLGGTPRISRDPAEVARARCLVLPGVGAFRPPRERLRGALETALGEALDGGTWLLGICIGFQLLFDASDEFGTTDGLGLLGGTVERLPDSVVLPHIGWNRLRRPAEHPLLDGVDDGAAFYFVHSYAPLDVAADHTLGQAIHGAPFVAVAGQGRVLGTQFHPEKSGPVGLRLLGNYLRLAASCN